MKPRPDFRVHICDGCCCGTERKHPGIDHIAQRERLAEAARAGGGRARVIGCLGACHASNLIVVRRRGHRAQWIGGILDDAITGSVCAWLASGAVELPDVLRAHLVERADIVPRDPPSAPVTQPVSIATFLSN